jgi:acyl phosphate:glycerol-3-phosphate acyltransferase
MALLWTLIGFFIGAIPFSVWLGKLVLRTDIRQYGDNNPGGTNVIRAGNRGLGALVIFLDMLKGAIPVGLAYYVFGVNGWSLVPVVLAPVFGHAFSPFLHFGGGKAVATTFGVWSSLTVPFGPFIMALSLLALVKLLHIRSGWAIMAAWLVTLVMLVVMHAALPLLVAWAVNAALLWWKHRDDLHQAPQLQPDLRRASR